jgi:subtilisin family serine protease
MAGMAQVTIMPVQVFSAGGFGTWEALAESVYYATDNNADTYNISGGGGGGTPDLAAACQYAYDNGMPVVAAAGNFNSQSPFYPASYDTVIAVSGTDRFDQRYNSSNYGNHIDVAAPAVDVYSCLGSTFNNYGSLTGTSMASPHVCGLTALCLTIDPDLTPDEIRALLRDNAVDLGDPGFDIFFGYGRIDAAATLAAIAPPCPADFDGDGFIGQADLAHLLASYNQDGGGDVDGDGDTDQEDLAELLSLYNTSC